MICKNPIIKGFYPAPSVCSAGGKYYMVCSSFQYFPSIPLFESEDLVNWKQIGYVLSRREQVELDKINSSGGIISATIRCHAGRFYVVAHHDTINKNFYVYTDDINGSWSDPVYVDQGGVDPSLYFEKNRCYFMSNGEDDSGVGGAVQCEINIETGEKLSESKCIWQGIGGRFLESPKVYKIGKWYYLLAAEGGTDYSHMITCARSRSLWGRYSRNPNNPVLSNRNKVPHIIQGISKGELVQDAEGNWFIFCLGFRQIQLWMPFHNLGCEVFIAPVKFGEDDWLTAGSDGTVDDSYEFGFDTFQTENKRFTFDNTVWNIDWCYMREPDEKKYVLSEDKAVLIGSDITLNDADSPTFLALRQKEFNFNMQAFVKLTPDEENSGECEAGFTVYMCENEHYEVSVRKRPDNEEYEAVLRLNIGGIKHIQKIIPIKSDNVKLIVKGDNFSYSFFFKNEDDVVGTLLGYGYTKYLTSEVSGGSTGVMLGMYATGKGSGEFTEFELEYR